MDRLPDFSTSHLKDLHQLLDQGLKFSALMIRRVIIINDALVSDPSALASDPITCNRMRQWIPYVDQNLIS